MKPQNASVPGGITVSVGATATTLPIGKSSFHKLYSFFLIVFAKFKVIVMYVEKNRTLFKYFFKAIFSSEALRISMGFVLLS